MAKIRARSNNPSNQVDFFDLLGFTTAAPKTFISGPAPADVVAVADSAQTAVTSTLAANDHPDSLPSNSQPDRGTLPRIEVPGSQPAAAGEIRVPAGADAGDGGRVDAGGRVGGADGAREPIVAGAGNGDAGAQPVPAAVRRDVDLDGADALGQEDGLTVPTEQDASTLYSSLLSDLQAAQLEHTTTTARLEAIVGRPAAGTHTDAVGFYAGFGDQLRYWQLRLDEIEAEPDFTATFGELNALRRSMDGEAKRRVVALARLLQGERSAFLYDQVTEELQRLNGLVTAAQAQIAANNLAGIGRVVSNNEGIVLGSILNGLTVKERSVANLAGLNDPAAIERGLRQATTGLTPDGKRLELIVARLTEAAATETVAPTPVIVPAEVEPVEVETNRLPVDFGTRVETAPATISPVAEATPAVLGGSVVPSEPTPVEAAEAMLGEINHEVADIIAGIELVGAEALDAPVDAALALDAELEVPPTRVVEAVVADVDPVLDDEAEIDDNAEPVVELSPEERNFHYNRDEDLAPRGRVSRIKANIAAITLVGALETENRLATEDEKLVLARYCGWGADKEVFNEAQAKEVERANQAMPHHRQMYYKEAMAWDKEYGRFYRELKTLLSEGDWNRAAASTLNAHYTSPALCHGLWDLAISAGFRGGAVLEPAIGTGQIIGAMPEHLSAVSEVTGVELDPVTARIAAKLYPQATIHNESFQDAFESLVPERVMDLVITNVPFSDVCPAQQHFEGEQQYNLHNLCIRASMEKLKPGGLAIIITSASTLQNNFKQRDSMSPHVQFMGAIRLPNNAFEGNANTEVVTDVLLLRKPDNIQVDHQPFRNVLPVDLLPQGVYTPHKGRPSEEERHQHTNVNEYFVRNPQMVLGYHSLNGKMYGASDNGQYTVMPHKDSDLSLAEQFGAAVVELPSDIPNPSLRKFERAQRREQNLPDMEENELVRLRARLGTKPGSFEIPAEDLEGGMKIGVTDRYGFLVPVPWRMADGSINPDAKFPRGYNADKADAIAIDYVELRRCLKNVIVTDLNPAATQEDSDNVRTSLRSAYEAFTTKWGKLNTTPALTGLLSGDTELGSVLALEKVRTSINPETKRDMVTVEPATILSARTLFPSAVPMGATSIEDGINISLAQYGRIDDEYVAKLLGKDQDVRGVRMLITGSGLAYENPSTGLLESRTQYLSGNVRVKLRQAREAKVKAENAPAGTIGESFQRNVEDLEKVQPPSAIFEEIVAPINAAWLPSKTVSRFAGTLLQQKDNHLQCVFYKHMMQWLITEGYTYTQEVRTTYGTPAMNAVKILDNVLNDRYIKITYKDDEGGIHLDEKATNQANAVADTIREAWKTHLKQDAQSQAEVVAAYNDTFRNVALPEYSGDYLTFPGLASGAGAMIPRKHQRDVVARLLTEQCGLAAHGVGFGKTFELTLAAYESRRMGICRKPVIVCDNASYPQFVETVRAAYPQANLLVADEMSMTPRNRQTFMMQMATGDWDIILCSHNHFTAMPSKPETQIAYFNEAINNLKYTLETMEAFEDSVPRHKVRQTQKSIERAEELLKKKMDELEENQDLGSLYFEDSGIDRVFIDEIHKFKRVPFETAHGDIKGVDTSNSQRALALLLKAQYVQAKCGEGRGVIGATGTPVTNTMAEVWNMCRLTAPKRLNDFGIPNFDMFVAAFAEKVTALELNESNGKWRNETRLAKFINGPDFIQFVRSFCDVKMDRDAVKLDVPKLKGGAIELCTVELTDAVSDIQDKISDIYDQWDNLTGIEKKEFSYIPLVLMGTGLAAAIDPRLINPMAPDEPESLVNKAVSNIASIYHATADKHSTQVVFLDNYSPRSTAALDRMGAGAFREIARLEDADALPGGEGQTRSKKPAGDEDEDKPKEIDFSQEEIPLDPMLTSRFNLYTDIKQKLVALGVAAEEIAVVGDAKNAAARAALFDRVNKGEIRIILGSTMRLGVGVNIQKKLVHAHHLDPARSMTPADMTQRNGRILRQGNENPEIGITYYGMKDTATPGIYDRLKRKDKFIEQCWAGKGVGVEFEDCGEVRLEEMKSVLISDKRQLARAELLAKIKSEKVTRETINGRRRTLSNEVENLIWNLDQYKDAKIPDATKLSDYFEHYVPEPVAGQPTTLTASAQGQSRDLSGSFEEVESRLEEMCKEWKQLKFGDSTAVQEMGQLMLNGMKIRISRQLASFQFADESSKGEAKVQLRASVLNPLGGTSYLSESRFATAEALFKLVRARRDDALREPAALRGKMRTYESDLEKTRVALEAAPKYEDQNMDQLEKDLATLEEDMKKNPYKRMTRAERARQADLEEQKAAAVAAGLPWPPVDESLPVLPIAALPEVSGPGAVYYDPSNRSDPFYTLPEQPTDPDLEEEEIEVVTMTL